jgi:P27 family predicted phage terminase small subunit
VYFYKNQGGGYFMPKKAAPTAKGRPRKSVAEKAKSGTLNQTRENRRAPEMKVVPISEFPKAPDDLGDDGKMHWDIVVRELTKIRVLSSVDLFNLRALCIEWECYLWHRREQMKSGVGSYYKLAGKNGDSFQPHPLHYNGTNHLREYSRLCNEFGLNPASRARIGVNAQENATSKAASLLKKAV